MSLKIRLKPHEKMLLGHAVIKNGDKATEFFVENTAAILREKDIMKEDAATSPARRLYFLIQLMYVDGENLVTYHHAYWDLVKQLLEAAPSTAKLIEEIGTLVVNHDYYPALKTSKKLIEYEQQLLSNLMQAAVNHS
jgi:flagellar biosynthesis repressor protein FlbT